MTTRRWVQLGAALVIVGAVADLIATGQPLPASINALDLTALGVVSGAVGLVALLWSLIVPGKPGERYSWVTALLSMLPLAWVGATIGGASSDLISGTLYITVEIGLVCGAVGGLLTMGGSLWHVQPSPTAKQAPPKAK